MPVKREIWINNFKQKRRKKNAQTAALDIPAPHVPTAKLEIPFIFLQFGSIEKIRFDQRRVLGSGLRCYAFSWS